MSDVVRATYYVVDMKEADRALAVCGEVFRDIRPASTIVAVTALYKPEMRVEIEVTAKRHGHVLRSSSRKRDPKTLDSGRG